MRILHVVDQISQTLHGGSAKVPFQLASAQAKLGHDVTIFSSDYEAKEQGAPEGVKLDKFKTVFSFQNLRFTPGMYLRDYRKFDIVHLHNYRTIVNLIIADVCYLPMVLQAHGNAAPITWRKWINPVASRVFKYGVLKRCQRYIADAESEIEHYLKEGAGREQISLIPVGIDLAEFKGLPAKQNHGYKNILFLGRLDKIKGLALFV